MRAAAEPAFLVTGTAALVLLSTATGCVVGSLRGTPLYPPSERPDTADDVAQLSGYVRDVDGRDVSRPGSSFELLPGCHVVGTPSVWGRSNLNWGGVVAPTGHLRFALPMRPGFAYTISVEVSRVMGDVFGTVRVVAYENDPWTGETTRAFDPAKSDNDLRACRSPAIRSDAVL